MGSRALWWRGLLARLMRSGCWAALVMKPIRGSSAFAGVVYGVGVAIGGGAESRAILPGGASTSGCVV